MARTWWAGVLAAAWLTLALAWLGPGLWLAHAVLRLSPAIARLSWAVEGLAPEAWQEFLDNWRNPGVNWRAQYVCCADTMCPSLAGSVLSYPAQLDGDIATILYHHFDYPDELLYMMGSAIVRGVAGRQPQVVILGANAITETARLYSDLWGPLSARLALVEADPALIPRLELRAAELGFSSSQATVVNAVIGSQKNVHVPFYSFPDVPLLSGKDKDLIKKAYGFMGVTDDSLHEVLVPGHTFSSMLEHVHMLAADVSMVTLDFLDVNQTLLRQLFETPGFAPHVLACVWDASGNGSDVLAAAQFLADRGYDVRQHGLYLFAFAGRGGPEQACAWPWRWR